VYTSLGAATVEVSLPAPAAVRSDLYVVAPAECSSNLSRFDGVRFGYRCDQPKDLADLYKRSRGEGFGPEVKRRIMTRHLCVVRRLFRCLLFEGAKGTPPDHRGFRAAFQQVDLVVGPTTPTPAFDIGAKIDDPVTMYLNDIYTIRCESRRTARKCHCRAASSMDCPWACSSSDPHFLRGAPPNAAHLYQRADGMAHTRSAGYE